MELDTLLKQAVEHASSDIFILAGFPVALKTKGAINPLDSEKLLPDGTLAMIGRIYELANRPMDRLVGTGDDDFSFSIPGLSRFRVSTYKQRGSFAASKGSLFAPPSFE